MSMGLLNNWFRRDQKKRSRTSHPRRRRKGRVTSSRRPSKSRRPVLKVDHNPSGQSDTNAFLSKENVDDPSDLIILSVDEEKEWQRLGSRALVLKVLILPMVVIPPWSMVMLSLAWVGQMEMPGEVQLALVGVLGGDIIGLCYVVTRDLFPNGQSGRSGDDNT